jgi:peptidoglycan hydrolase-like protein with peptidoglycan-binding domain
MKRFLLLLVLLTFPLFASATTFTRDLVQGSQGSEVTSLQQVLKGNGYLNATPTGYFGPLTTAALS